MVRMGRQERGGRLGRARGPGGAVPTGARQAVPGRGGGASPLFLGVVGCPRNGENDVAGRAGTEDRSHQGQASGAWQGWGCPPSFLGAIGLLQQYSYGQ